MNMDMRNLFPIEEGKFNFMCHKGLPCFTKCCFNLNLILTPYDVLRIRKRLNIDSNTFIDTYADIDMEEYPPFPVLKLRMMDKDKRCPFLTKEGCSIYEDRPTACRLYPLARASTSTGKEVKERFFLIKEDHCLGLKENKQWEIKEWIRHEGVEEYDKFNFPWFEIVTSSDELLPAVKDNLFKNMKAFFMASYNLESFKKYILTDKFFKIYNVPEQYRNISEDTDVLSLSLEWIRFVLYGKKGNIIS